MTTRGGVRHTVDRMLHAATATWVPTAAGVGLAVLLFLGLAWSCVRRSPPDGTDEPDEGGGGGGGGGGPRRPRRPPPVGPVSWVDFERQFAAHVMSRTGERPGSGLTGDRTGEHFIPSER